MSSEMEALGGKPAETTDWKQKCEELEKQLNSTRVEAGRVKKLDEELKARERELSELKAVKNGEGLLDAIPKEEREAIPDEILKVATKLVSGGMQKMQAENERRFQELAERRESEAKASRQAAEDAFVRRINVSYPKFLSSIGAGGDKAAEWASYKKFNEASILAAMQSMDFETLAYHIEAFYRNYLGVPIPKGGEGAATEPDPTNHGGGNSERAFTPGKTYTQDEYIALYDAVERARDKGDYAEMARINAEIKAAPAEGRVK